MSDPHELLYAITQGNGTGFHCFDFTAPADMEATNLHRLTFWCATDSRRRFLRLASPSELRLDVEVSAVPYVELENRR